MSIQQIINNNLLNEKLSIQEFDDILQRMNNFFKKYGVRVIFRQHFIDRINDNRNKQEITREIFLNILNKLFQDTIINKLRKMKPGQEGVMIYKTTNFVYTLDIVGKEIQMRFITAMDKDKFYSNTSKDFILKLESFKDYWKRKKIKNSEFLEDEDVADIIDINKEKKNEKNSLSKSNRKKQNRSL